MSETDREKVNTFFAKFIFDYMCHDIEAAIKGKANFLAALSLSEYTEIMGGLRTGKLCCKSQSGRNYKAFLCYLGAPYVALHAQLNSKGGRYKGGLYKLVRCGLAHEQFIKGPSIVEMDDTILQANPSVDPSDCGIVYSGDTLTFRVNHYYRDFKIGIKKLFCELLAGEHIEEFSTSLEESAPSFNQSSGNR